CGTRAQDSARAILMALGSSVSSLWDQSLMGTATAVLLPGSTSLPGSLDLSYKRNHNHTTAQCLLQPR
ncbi:hypothetical protein, partial [Streptomyces endophyticus]